MPTVGEELLRVAADPAAPEEEHNGRAVGARAALKQVQTQIALRRRLVDDFVGLDLIRFRRCGRLARRQRSHQSQHAYA